MDDWAAHFEFGTVGSPSGTASSEQQMPTPPLSKGGSPYTTNEPFSPLPTPTISVSTTFHTGARLLPLPVDMAFLSTDNVYFYVHSKRISDDSENAFGSILSRPSERSTHDNYPAYPVPLMSPVLNIILHTIYDMSCAHYAPTLDEISMAVENLRVYGLYVETYIAPNSPLFTLILSHAPLRPVDVYALAAHYNLSDLAIPTSSHLLSLNLSTINDDIAKRMGPVYLKRLFFLHLGRMDALRRILLPPPHPHAPTPSCDFGDQKAMTRAWALASSYLAWDARPDTSTSSMESALNPLLEHVTCRSCHESLSTRIRELIVNWSLIKRTI